MMITLVVCRVVLINFCLVLPLNSYSNPTSPHSNLHDRPGGYKAGGSGESDVSLIFPAAAAGQDLRLNLHTLRPTA